MDKQVGVSILKSFFDPQSIARLITEAYSLSDVRCQLIKATMRDVYHVSCHEGTFIALIYRANQPLESIREEITLTDYLVAKEFPTVTAVHHHQKDDVLDLAAPEGIRYLVLIPFVSGVISRQPELALIEAYGALVSRFHQLADDMPLPKARPIYNAETLLVQSMNTLSATTGYLQTVLDELRRTADKLEPVFQDLPKTQPEYGIVHGDIIPSNALIAPDNTLILIDFDLFGLGWRTYDIASYLNEIAFWQMGMQATATFLRGYGRVRALSAQELHTLPYMQIARQIKSLYTAAANVNTWGSSVYLSERLIDTTLNNIRQLSAQMNLFQ